MTRQCPSCGGFCSSKKCERENLMYKNHQEIDTSSERVDEIKLPSLPEPEAQALRKDAERYRWLRQQHWSESEMCIVCRPKETVKPGSYCPSLDLLDSHIDAAMEGQK